MFQAQTFRPGAGRAFLPPIRLAGHPPPFLGAFLGLSLSEGRQYYERAKAAVMKFDALVARAARIDYKPARDTIVEKYGLDDPNNKDKARYMRDTLQNYVAEVEANPAALNYYVFIQETSRPRNRTDWVEDVDKDFEADVSQAERLYGVTREPQVLTREVMVASGLAIPILIGAGVVALVLAFG